MSPISLIVYICSPHEYRLNTLDLISINHIIRIMMMSTLFFLGTGYEYDGYVFVAWVLQVRRFPDMDPYFTEINHVLLASRGYEYDGFLFS